MSETEATETKRTRTPDPMRKANAARANADIAVAKLHREKAALTKALDEIGPKIEAAEQAAKDAEAEYQRVKASEAQA